MLYACGLADLQFLIKFVTCTGRDCGGRRTLGRPLPKAMTSAENHDQPLM